MEIIVEVRKMLITGTIFTGAKMLEGENAVATVAVRDVAAAAGFYEKTLGLGKLESGEKSILLFQSGSSKLIVYQSQFAGTNQATAVTWPVKDVAAVARDLKGRGVTFERYDFPNATYEGDVHVMGKRRAAWFKDPDGNIHAVVDKD